MTDSWERSRRAGSLAAGLLIGLAFAVAAFGATEADSGARQIFLIVAAPVLLLLGLTVQVLVTAHSSRVD